MLVGIFLTLFTFCFQLTRIRNEWRLVEWIAKMKKNWLKNITSQNIRQSKCSETEKPRKKNIAATDRPKISKSTSNNFLKFHREKFLKSFKFSKIFTHP